MIDVNKSTLHRTWTIFFLLHYHLGSFCQIYVHLLPRLPFCSLPWMSFISPFPFASNSNLLAPENHRAETDCYPWAQFSKAKKKKGFWGFYSLRKNCEQLLSVTLFICKIMCAPGTLVLIIIIFFKSVFLKWRQQVPIFNFFFKHKL